MNVLLLAGTAEARVLAETCVREGGVQMTASFAGGTRQRAPFPCSVRVGGFGGVDGLVRYLVERCVDALVDATHPFADEMPWQAVAAAHATNTPYLRLVRDPWEPATGDRWLAADDIAHAARRIVEIRSRRALLTIGRLDLTGFAGVIDTHLVVRTIDPPNERVLPSATYVSGRGPFTVAGEIDVLREHRIDLLVTKNSGGDAAKLIATRRLGLPVVMIQRPPSVPARTCTTPADARTWLRALRASNAS
jgi:precorrin-6A/cobalt-precorrin-6A reductase